MTDSPKTTIDDLFTQFIKQTEIDSHCMHPNVYRHTHCVIDQQFRDYANEVLTSDGKKPVGPSTQTYYRCETCDMHSFRPFGTFRGYYDPTEHHDN